MANAAAKEVGGPVVESPTVTLRNYDQHSFGNLFIQSHTASGRSWTPVCELGPQLAGQHVWVRARLATSRKQGKMLCFLQLRESMHTVQAVVYSKGDIVPFAAQVPRESIVDVYGEVTVPSEKVASCSQSDVELQVQKTFVVSRSLPELSLQLEDASRSDVDLAADLGLAAPEDSVRAEDFCAAPLYPCSATVACMYH